MVKANVTANELHSRLSTYLASREGRSRASKMGKLGVGEAEIDALMKEFASFMTRRIREVIPSFNSKNSTSAFLWRKVGANADGSYKLAVSIDRSYLWRESFKDGHGVYTGDGLYDVIGLFVQGYAPTDKRVWGYWHNHGKRMYENPREKKGRPFIQNAVSAFEQMHSDANVRIKITNSLWV